MKNALLFIAFVLITALTACQKESTLSSFEQWLLLEQSWSVTVTRGATTTFEAITPTGTQVTGTEISIAQLPTAILQRLQTDGININSIIEVWQVNGGGYVLKVQAGGVINVYWFTSPTNLESIGKVVS